MGDKIRMSNSSFNQMNSCEMRYAHRKIFGTKVDSDIDTDKPHFKIGSCFHEILEHCLHNYDDSDIDTTYACFESHNIDSDQDRGLILAMVRKYSELHKKSGLTVIGCEDEVGDDYTIGFIDAIMIDAAGFYYITDLKTAGRFDNNLLARLKRDSQLNLYSYFRGQVEQKYGLDPEKFAGILYRVTQKVSRVKKASESLDDYVNRLLPLVESYSIFIPADELDPDSAYQAVRTAQVKATKFRDEGLEPKRDFGKCFEYFTACDYFSKCYGFLHTEASDHFSIENSKNIQPMVQEDPELEDLL